VEKIRTLRPIVCDFPGGAVFRISYPNGLAIQTRKVRAGIFFENIPQKNKNPILVVCSVSGKDIFSKQPSSPYSDTKSRLSSRLRSVKSSIFLPDLVRASRLVISRSCSPVVFSFISIVNLFIAAKSGQIYSAFSAGDMIAVSVSYAKAIGSWTKSSGPPSRAVNAPKPRGCRDYLRLFLKAG
jgi:hypothetical protein